MLLQSYIQSWSGFAVRHIPEGPYEIYDFSRCGLGSENRWNVTGEPTLYLAKERDVALAEFARHMTVDRTESLVKKVRRRKVYRFEVSLDNILDLCRLEVCQALSLLDVPNCFLDKDIARATARFIRKTTVVQAIKVPSVAFLDNLEQWCLVVFLEKLPPDSRQVLPSVAEDGFFDV